MNISKREIRFICLYQILFFSFCYLYEKSSEWKYNGRRGITERFAERSAWKGGRSEYSWGQLGQFHQRRKWHQVAVYPRGYCSRHVQPATISPFAAQPLLLHPSLPFRNCQPPSRWNQRWPTKCSRLSGPVGNGLRQVYVRNHPNWPRLSYQDTNRVTVEVPLKGECCVDDNISEKQVSTNVLILVKA